MPSSVKVDCISINTLPVKGVIDDHIRSLFDALVDSLRRAINKDMAEMEAFLDLANAKLVTRPQTVAEVGEANASHAEFREKRLQLIPFVKGIETRNKLLRQVNQGQGVDAINKLQVRNLVL